MGGRGLTVRDRQPELMDQPGLDLAQHEQALRGLRRINWWSRTVPVLWHHLRDELQRQQVAHPDRNSPLRVLDVACGGGDTVVALGRKARRSGLPIQVDGCDISETAIAVARRNAARQATDSRFFVADALQEILPSGYDVMMSSLFLHHLDDDDAVRLLQHLQVARRLVIVSDLRRTRLGYFLAYWGTRLLSRSTIVHIDGPLSVRAAWTEVEAAQLARRAGMAQVEVARVWPQRFLLLSRGGA